RLLPILLDRDDVWRRHWRGRVLLRPLRASGVLPFTATGDRSRGNPGGSAPGAGPVPLPLGTIHLGALRAGRRSTGLFHLSPRAPLAAELRVPASAGHSAE